MHLQLRGHVLLSMLIISSAATVSAQQQRERSTCTLLPVPHAGKFGYIDGSGKLLISARFDNAECFHEGLALVQVGSRYGFIDKFGELVIPSAFEDASSFSEVWRQ